MPCVCIPKGEHFISKVYLKSGIGPYTSWYRHTALWRLFPWHFTACTLYSVNFTLGLKLHCIQLLGSLLQCSWLHCFQLHFKEGLEGYWDCIGGAGCTLAPLSQFEELFSTVLHWDSCGGGGATFSQPVWRTFPQPHFGKSSLWDPELLQVQVKIHK